MKKLSCYIVLACLLGLLLYFMPVSAVAEGTVILPLGLKVIEEEAFYGVEAIDKVVIPEGTTEIHSLAFVGCSLTEVVLPSTLTYIAADAFDVNANLKVTVPKNCYAYDRCLELQLIEEAGAEATPEEYFTYEAIDDTYCRIIRYTGTATEVVIPRTLGGRVVFSIKDSAFAACTSLNSVVIPDGVLVIGSYAFEDCTSLTSISLPEGLETIGFQSFMGCSALQNIHLPDSVEFIGDGAFANCERLASVNFPQRLATAGVLIFNGCKELKTIVVPEGVTKIPMEAFYGADYLTSIELPSTLNEIEDSAFEDCCNLTSIVIPAGVKAIGESAFSWCTNLESVTLPSSVTTIGARAFKYCKNLTVYGVAGSYAETYANENGINFVAIDSTPPVRPLI